MLKKAKKIIIILLLCLFPIVITGCENSSGVNQETSFYLTPKYSEISIISGEKKQIEIDTNIDLSLLSWESYDERICTVNEEGIITAKKSGTTTIYCYYLNYEFEINIIVSPKPITYYHLTIDGYDTIDTTKFGVALIYLLKQEYGEKLHPNFGNYIFHGYYEDKDFTKKLDLYTKLDKDITIYPMLTLDTTQCDLMFSISNTLFFEDELILNDGIQVLTSDYSSSTKNDNVNYENTFMVVVEYDYELNKHFVTNTYVDGNKQNINIPYNGFVILIPKTDDNYDALYNGLKIGTNISLDRYSINVANRIYVNEKYNTNKYDQVDPTITALYSAAYDLTNKQYLFQKNADSKAYPASTTKLITALAAIQHAPLDLKITIGDELDVMYEGSSPGTAKSKKGQVWTLRQLLYAMLLPSGNDSAYSIAAGVARSIPGNENKSTRELLSYFNELMNDVRDQVGATNSNFMVPDGNSYYEADGSWSERITNHYVTANDMIKFASFALNCPILAKVVSTHTVNFKLENGESYIYTNTNSLINPSSDYYCEYAIGLKTGTTNPAGNCLIFAIEFEGRIIICSVLKSESRYTDSLKIINALTK